MDNVIWFVWKIEGIGVENRLKSKVYIVGVFVVGLECFYVISVYSRVDCYIVNWYLFYLMKVFKV